MSEQIPPSPGADGSTPVPRDTPDQQAGSGQDPWEPAENTKRENADGEDGASDDVPDTDEAGTGRRGEGAPRGVQDGHDASAPTDEPEPEEPSG
ncbi:hypothetical protein [Streptomyces sp. NPDC087300]|uniref:hypothetical protein n=1 Tax=Streptomyces sp. NPDC087300 TaxID=3365780 RepID=UPI0038230662